MLLSAKDAQKIVENFDWAPGTGDSGEWEGVRQLVLELVTSEVPMADEVASDLNPQWAELGKDEADVAPLAELFLKLTLLKTLREPETVLWAVMTLYMEFKGGDPEGALKQVLTRRKSTLNQLWRRGKGAKRDLAMFAAVCGEPQWVPRIHEQLLTCAEHDIPNYLIAYATLSSRDVNLVRTALKYSAKKYSVACARAAAAVVHLVALENQAAVADLSEEERTFADEYGLPGMFKSTYASIALPMPDALNNPTVFTKVGEWESAEVLFATASMIVARHHERGNYTVKIKDSGVAKGDEIQLRGFVPGATRSVRGVRRREGSGWQELLQVS